MKPVKTMIIAASTMFLVVGCTATERGAAVGGLAGAAVGGAVTGDIRGAAVGGVVGAAAGALVGAASEPGRCIYRDRFGREYIAACP